MATEIHIRSMPDQRTLARYLANGPAKVVFNLETGSFTDLGIDPLEAGVHIFQMPDQQVLETFLLGTHQEPTVVFNVVTGVFEKI